MTPSYHKYKHICVFYLGKYCILLFPKMKLNLTCSSLSCIVIDM